MDKNRIKSFAIWARRNLISAVSERANRIGVTENKIEEVIIVQGGFKFVDNDEIFKLSKADRDKLVDEVKGKGFDQVMEEVAYTWFNRFMGLRYMEVNDYLPTGIRVLSSEVEGKAEPDVLTRVSEVIEELKLNSEYIYELLDSGKTEDREEVYKYILVRQCNELGNIIPQMFEKLSDYTELLLPDNLLEEGSIIRKMVGDIEEYDWKEEVEIIGWMYQYYNDEKKNEVINIYKGTVKKEDIPAATQLFTTDWVVRYMVDNSLGKLWLEKNPKSGLRNKLKFYLNKYEGTNEININENKEHLSIEEIKFLDPCMGSGHILVYAFDVFMEIYKECGYSEREAAKIIVNKNLYGLDIDNRASQLAYFSIIMKARKYNRRIFREDDINPNLLSIQESNKIFYLKENINIELDSYYIDIINYLIEKFRDAKEIGSIQKIENNDYDGLLIKIDELQEQITSDLFINKEVNDISLVIPQLIKQAKVLSEKYDIVATNPPYLSKMEGNLKKFVNNNYKKYSGDLFSVFTYRNFDFCKENGYSAFMTPFVWMFIKTYENLRDHIINQKSISSLIQLEYSAFDEATVPICTFVLKNSKSQYKGTYIRLSEFKGGMEVQKQKVLESIYSDSCDYIYLSDSKNFNYIPGKPISYWISNKVYEIFKNEKNLGNYAEPKSGLSTTDNIRFLRYWNEVNINNVGFNYSSISETENCKKRWFPYNKGGSFRRWYGNRYYCVNWYNNGSEIKEAAKGASGGRVVNPEFYFKESITWSSLSSGDLSVRYSESGFIFDSKGSSCFTDVHSLYLLGFLNSKVAMIFLEILSPTLDFNPGSISKLPVIMSVDKNKEIEELVSKCILLSKYDWNSFENSWNFKRQPLLKLLEKDYEYKLKDVFLIFKNECEEKFNLLKSYEESLNKIFIDIYGLQNELVPKIEDKVVTIRKADRERDIKSFISYAVGCMFGRYSIDAEGLIYAGGEFKEKWHLNDKKVKNIETDEDCNVISDSWVDATFLPDGDNVSPITEDEYFEDDIISRFIEFVRTVYSNETLEENLDFIAESIGRKPSETSRQAIRRYFIKDFYKDHLKVYQKRPIYWMFDSGKNDGFKALIYMHRYNDQTIAKVRTDYLHTLQRKYEGEIQRQQLIVDSEEYTIKDRAAARKKIDRIAKQIEECREYDQVVASLANEKISIDLDDGVKVNYEKFQGVKVINSKGKEVKMDLLSKI